MPIRLVFLFSHSICLRIAVVSRHLDESSKWDDHFKVMYVRHQIKIRTVRHLSSFDRHESWMHICARLIVKMQRNMIWLRNVNFHHQKREREKRMLNRKKALSYVCNQSEKKEWFYAWNIFTFAVTPRDTPAVCLPFDTCMHVLHRWHLIQSHQ